MRVCEIISCLLLTRLYRGIFLEHRLMVESEIKNKFERFRFSINYLKQFQS